MLLLRKLKLSWFLSPCMWISPHSLICRLSKYVQCSKIPVMCLMWVYLILIYLARNFISFKLEINVLQSWKVFLNYFTDDSTPYILSFSLSGTCIIRYWIFWTGLLIFLRLSCIFHLSAFWLFPGIQVLIPYLKTLGPNVYQSPEFSGFYKAIMVYNP